MWSFVLSKNKKTFNRLYYFVKVKIEKSIIFSLDNTYGIKYILNRINIKT